MKITKLQTLIIATIALFASVTTEKRTNLMKVTRVHKPKVVSYFDPGFNVTENAIEIKVELELHTSQYEPITTLVSVLNPQGQMVPDQNSYVKIISKEGAKIEMAVIMAGYHLLEPNSNVYLTVMTRKNTFLQLLFVAPQYNTLPKIYIGEPEEMMSFIRYVFVFSMETSALIKKEILAGHSVNLQLPFNTEVNVTFDATRPAEKANFAKLTAEQTASYSSTEITPIEISTLNLLAIDIAKNDPDFHLFSEGYKPITYRKIQSEVESGRRSMVVNLVDKNRKLTNYVVFPISHEPICEVRPAEKSPEGSITIYCTGPGDEISYTANMTLLLNNTDGNWVKAEGFEKFQIHFDVYFIKAGASTEDLSKSYKVVTNLSDYAGNYAKQYESEIMVVSELGAKHFGMQELQMLIWTFISFLTPMVFMTLTHCTIYRDLK